jgi:hypothetical protein
MCLRMSAMSIGLINGSMAGRKECKRRKKRERKRKRTKARKSKETVEKQGKSKENDYCTMHACV